MLDEFLFLQSFVFTPSTIILLEIPFSLFFIFPLTLNKLHWFFPNDRIILSVSLIFFGNHRTVWTQRVDKANPSVVSYQNELFKSSTKLSISVFSKREFISCFVNTLSYCESDKFIAFRNWLSLLWQLFPNYFCGLWSKWLCIVF